jgi:phosphoserine phosphatase RsbU/P
VEFQTNPYLIWQLIPGFALLSIGFYIQSRPIKKRESNVFSLLMFGGAFWAFANAIQLMTPNVTWQMIWNTLTYAGIMVVPTAWFLLSSRLTGFQKEWLEKFEKYFWLPPAILYLLLLTNGVHENFFSASFTIALDEYVVLKHNYGWMFYLHTAYSYALMILGMGILAYSLTTKFKTYGIQAYGLIVGVVAPLAGNIYFLFGSPPQGFPDPTPIIFTVTGVAFAWAIFGGHILEVVPLAHEAIVHKLSTGVIILDAEKNIRDINAAALAMLKLLLKSYVGIPLVELAQQNADISPLVNEALNLSAQEDKEIQISLPQSHRIFNVQISGIDDGLNKISGWLIQFSDVSEKKQAELNLVATQETMKTVMNTLQDGFFEADKNGVLTYVNKAFIQNLGFARWEDVQGKHFRNFTDRNNFREIFEKFKTIYETKKPVGPFLYNYRTKDGNTLIAETTVSPIMNGNEVIGSRGVIRNITDRIYAEKEILRQKELLDNVIQQSPIAMVINNMEKKITVVNPAFEKLFGYTQEEAVGQNLDQLLKPPKQDDNEDEFLTFNLKKQATRERSRRKKDGTLVDVEVFIAPFFVSGERFGYLVFYNDISERLKTEANLRKTQTSYFSVLDTLRDPYFEVLTSGYFVYVNNAFYEWTGYARGELVGKNFRIVTSRKSIRETINKFEILFQDGKPIPKFEFVYRRKDGKEFAAEMVVSPIMEESRVVGARGIIRDISERVQTEEVLRQAKAVAESRAKELAVLNRVSLSVSRSLDLQDILQSICYELTNIFEIRNAGIGLLTPDRKNLEIVAFHAVDPQEQSVKGMFLPVEGNTSAMEVIRTKKTVVIQDAQNDLRTNSIADLSRQRGTKSIMIVPLLARGEAIGTIGMPALNPDHEFKQNEIELAEIIASQIATAVDNAQLYQKTEMALDAAERDLEIGRQIQSGFFPEQLPTIPGWEIAAQFHAARQVSGDFYDVFRIKDSNFVALAIADVCDKGVGAALFMVLFRSLLRAFSETKITKNTIQQRLLNTIASTNTFIAEYHGKSNMFATLFFGILDPQSGTLYYVNGGHEPPILLNAKGNIIKRLMPTGPAVGMFSDLEFNVEHIKLNKGDMLIGFTDGSTDAKNVSGELFTEERLLQNLSKPWTSNFSALYELNTALQKHIGTQSQFDDITLISLRCNPSANANPTHTIERRAELSALSELREFVHAVAKYSGLIHDDIFAFRLAVDELCANIIQYGFESGETGKISLSFEVEKDVARLMIRDNGKYFSPDQAESPNIEADWEERQIGGLGIYFVKELMDTVTYNKVENGFNQFVLEKKIKNFKTNKER